jgi:hypothetical protein
MTPEQIEIALSFNRVTFLPGSWNKMFAHSLNSQAKNRPELELSKAQDEWMYRILYTFRKQIPDVYQKYCNNPNCKKL